MIQLTIGRPGGFDSANPGAPFDVNSGACIAGMRGAFAHLKLIYGVAEKYPSARIPEFIRHHRRAEHTDVDSNWMSYLGHAKKSSQEIC